MQLIFSIVLILMFSSSVHANVLCESGSLPEIYQGSFLEEDSTTNESIDFSNNHFVKKDSLKSQRFAMTSCLIDSLRVVSGKTTQGQTLNFHLGMHNSNDAYIVQFSKDSVQKLKLGEVDIMDLVEDKAIDDEVQFFSLSEESN